MFGGYDGVHRMNDFYKLTLENYAWSVIYSNGEVPNPRYFHSSVVYGECMYLFGGYNGSERLQDLF